MRNDGQVLEQKTQEQTNKMRDIARFLTRWTRTIQKTNATLHRSPSCIDLASLSGSDTDSPRPSAAASPAPSTASAAATPTEYALVELEEVVVIRDEPQQHQPSSITAALTIAATARAIPNTAAAAGPDLERAEGGLPAEDVDVEAGSRTALRMR